MKRLFWLLTFFVAFGSCKNADHVFDNNIYQTVYFAYQYPVRTITLGEDLSVNNDLDNQHKCKIMATLAGVYSNNQNVTIGLAVDNSLASGLLFGSGKADIKAMPSNYYALASNSIVIEKGSITGGVEVQLTDAFFADPNAVKNTYVIPVKMTSVSNGDSILSTKNFTLYAVKYINTWTGFYLRRGKDTYAGSMSKTVSRHQPYVENDEVNQLTTISLSQSSLPLSYKDKNGYNVACNLLLTFDASGNCTISSGTTGVTASGSGSFVKRGDKNSWGNIDRDALYLNYTVNFSDMSVTTTDTLVMRNRGVAIETFNPVSK